MFENVPVAHFTTIIQPLAFTTFGWATIHILEVIKIIKNYLVILFSKERVFNIFCLDYSSY